jgi:hypothetical protein
MNENVTPSAMNDQLREKTLAEAVSAASPTLEDRLASAAAPLLAPKRRIDLAAAVLPDVGNIEAVEVLEVRELKGAGKSFTPDVASALTFLGIAYKRPDKFDPTYQIIVGDLQFEPLIVSLARPLVFVPVFSWSTQEVVLLPIKINNFGERILIALQKVQPAFPNIKVFIRWNDVKRRFDVKRIQMTDQEAAIIRRVCWPSREQILDALNPNAFEDMEGLAAANEEIKILLGAREVE